MTSLAFFLRLNAASCVSFGALFVILPGAIGDVLGGMPPAVLAGVGVVLLINGAHLLLASMRARPVPAEIVWFSLGDLAWWLATLGLIASGIWITTSVGIALALVVALCVAGLGCAQLFLLGIESSGLTPREHWRRIGWSWLSLPLWVKVWLFALNAVFLLSPTFLPWKIAGVVLIAYLASGPLLLGFAVFEGGLTRAMGLGHLVPWTPMLVWLVAWIAVGEVDGPTVGYAAMLAAVTVICLAFDVYDLWRWGRGDRGIIANSGAEMADPRPA
ncbi:MAG: hypothetical protein M3414_08480 [Pseudomonadota bacterium]|nr:hypothetical protein [Pseudomonadota bacterium]